MYENDALAFHMSTMMGNQDTPIIDDGLYELGSNYATVSVEGRASLTLLAFGVIGLMAFYVITRSSQF